MITFSHFILFLCILTVSSLSDSDINTPNIHQREHSLAQFESHSHENLESAPEQATKQHLSTEETKDHQFDRHPSELFSRQKPAKANSVTLYVALDTLYDDPHCTDRKCTMCITLHSAFIQAKAISDPHISISIGSGTFNKENASLSILESITSIIGLAADETIFYVPSFGESPFLAASDTTDTFTLSSLTFILTSSSSTLLQATCSGTIRLSSLSFQSTSEGVTGPVIHTTTCILQIQQCAINNIDFTGKEGGGGWICAQSGQVQLTTVSAAYIMLSSSSLIQAREGALTLKNSTFQSIQLQKGEGTVLHLAQGTLQISGTTFSTTSNVDGHGGAVVTGSTAGVDIIIKNVSFTKCTATKGDGGALYLSNVADVNQLDFSNLVFFGCLAMNGNNFCVSGTVSQSDLSDHFSFFDATYILTNDFVFAASDGTYIPIFSGDDSVGIIDTHRGDDERTDCGLQRTWPCLTLATAYSHHPAIATFWFTPGVHPPEVAQIEIANTPTLCGSSYTTTTKQVENVENGLFTIPETTTSGDFQIQNLAFVFNISTSPLRFPLIISTSSITILLSNVMFTMAVLPESTSLLQTSVIELHSGYLILDSLIAESISLESHALIETSQASVMLKGASSFKSVYRSDSGGSVVESLLSPSLDSSGNPATTFSLSNVTVIDCGSTDAHYGAAFKVSPPIRYQLTISFPLSQDTYTANTHNKCALWIDATETVLTANNDSLHNLMKPLKSDASAWGEIEYKYLATVNRTHTTMLAHFYYSQNVKNPTTTQAQSIAMNGISWKTCGWTDLPCSSIDEALKYKHSTQATIQVLNSEDSYPFSFLHYCFTTSLSLVGESRDGCTVLLEYVHEDDDTDSDTDADTDTETDTGTDTNTDIDTDTDSSTDTDTDSDPVQYSLFELSNQLYDVTLSTMTVIVKSDAFVTSQSPGSLTLRALTFTGHPSNSLFTHPIIVSSDGSLILEDVITHTLGWDSNTPFIRATDGAFTMTSCRLSTAPLSPEEDKEEGKWSKKKNDDAEDIAACAWEGGFVHLAGSSLIAELSLSVLANISGGALLLDSVQSLSLDSMTFENNSHPSNPFAQHYSLYSENIICKSTSSSTLSIRASEGYYGFNPSALWIYNDGCSLENIFTSPLFVPSVETVSYEFHVSGFLVTFAGHSLFNCGLLFRLSADDTITTQYTVPYYDEDKSITVRFADVPGSTDKTVSRIDLDKNVQVQLHGQQVITPWYILLTPQESQSILIDTYYSPADNVSCDTNISTCYSLFHALSIEDLWKATLLPGTHQSEIRICSISHYFVLYGTVQEDEIISVKKIRLAPFVHITDSNTNVYDISFSLDISSESIQYSAVLFEVSNDAALILDNVRVYSSSTSLSHSVISTPALRLTDVQFSNISLKNESLITMSNSSNLYMLGDNQFLGISRSSGNGSVFSFILSGDASLSLSNATFKTCSCTGGGFGGSLYMYIFSSFNISRLRFSNLLFFGDGSAYVGNYVYAQQEEEGLLPSSLWDALMEHSISSSPSDFVLDGPDASYRPYLEPLSSYSLGFHLFGSQLAVMILLLIALLCVIIILGICFFYRRPKKADPEQPSRFAHISTVIFAFFKFFALIPFAYLPNSQPTSAASIFSTPALRDLFEFGRGLFALLFSSFETIKVSLGIILLIIADGAGVGLIVTRCFCAATPSSSDSRDGSLQDVLTRFFTDLIELLVDSLFTITITFLSPLLQCTEYSLTEEELRSFTVPSFGPEASCRGSTRVALLWVALIFFLIYAVLFFIFFYFRTTESPSWWVNEDQKERKFYPSVFTIIQDTVHTIMVAVSLFVELPIVVYIINLVCSAAIFAFAIIVVRQSRTTYRKVNLILYGTNLLATVISLIIEASNRPRVFSIISLLLVIDGFCLALIFAIYPLTSKSDRDSMDFHDEKTWSRILMSFSFACVIFFFLCLAIGIAGIFRHLPPNTAPICLILFSIALLSIPIISVSKNLRAYTTVAGSLMLLLILDSVAFLISPSLVDSLAKQDFQSLLKDINVIELDRQMETQKNMSFFFGILVILIAVTLGVGISIDVALHLRRAKNADVQISKAFEEEIFLTIIPGIVGLIFVYYILVPITYSNVGSYMRQATKTLFILHMLPVAVFAGLLVLTCPCVCCAQQLRCANSAELCAVCVVPCDGICTVIYSIVIIIISLIYGYKSHAETFQTDCAPTTMSESLDIINGTLLPNLAQSQCADTIQSVILYLCNGTLVSLSDALTDDKLDCGKALNLPSIPNCHYRFSTQDPDWCYTTEWYNCKCLSVESQAPKAWEYIGPLVAEEVAPTQGALLKTFGWLGLTIYLSVFVILICIGIGHLIDQDCPRSIGKVSPTT